MAHRNFGRRLWSTDLGYVTGRKWAGQSPSRPVLSPIGASRPCPAIGERRLLGADKAIDESKISSSLSFES
jgi:hypothetical protein